MQGRTSRRSTSGSVHTSSVPAGPTPRFRLQWLWKRPRRRDYNAAGAMPLPSRERNGVREQTRQSELRSLRPRRKRAMTKEDLTTGLTRRRFMQGAAGATTALLAGGFPGGLSAAEAKELRILSPGGSWRDWFESIFVTPYAT